MNFDPTQAMDRSLRVIVDKFFSTHRQINHQYLDQKLPATASVWLGSPNL